LALLIRICCGGAAIITGHDSCAVSLMSLVTRSMPEGILESEVRPIPGEYSATMCYVTGFDRL
jgi:hypothetical protein